MLLLISVYLFCILHLPAQQLKEWTYNEPETFLMLLQYQKKPLLRHF
jgi:hypothetical protein